MIRRGWAYLRRHGKRIAAWLARHTTVSIGYGPVSIQFA